MALYGINRLPADAAGIIHWAVQPGDWVVREDQTVVAEPGDHVIGTRTRNGQQLTVVLGSDCPACTAAALGHGPWPIS